VTWADDNARVPFWFRALRLAGVVLGGAGLVAAVWHDFAGQADRGGFGGLSWVGVGVAPLLGVGIWLAYRRPEHPQARRLLLMGSALAVNVGLEGLVRDAVDRSGPGSWLWWPNLIYQYSGVLALIAGVLLLASFPDGVVERRWQAVVLRAVWLHLLLPPLLLLSNRNLVFDTYLFDPAPSVPSPAAVSWLAPLAAPLRTLYFGYYGGALMVSVLFVRFIQAGKQRRARMRLLMYVTALLIPVYGLSITLSPRFGGDPPVWLRLLDGFSVVLLMMIPVSIVVGIVRHRLFDIDLVVRRSVVYGLLSLVIAAVYLGLTAAPGLALGSRIPVELAVLLTIVAAAACQPLRRRLEGLADRWVFGERVNRYQLLTEFGASLEQTVSLGELLPRLAETVRLGLAARWVRVTLPGASAVAGEPAGEPALRVPLGAAGQIECAKDEAFADTDRELLATLAGQAATAIANVRLTATLAEQVEELARSRARIVAAQDTERRRIERNIHDGAQQQVVALIMKLRLARNQVSRGDRGVGEVFDELAADARELLTDLRELAHGIHPPVLSDQGLVAAVEARADRLPLDVLVRADGGLDQRRLGEEVEGAAYFVICEALTNVVKHSCASSAGVELSTKDGTLEVLVRDNGIGLSGDSGGHGLTNLRDRVEALGGALRVDSEPGQGTSVRASLPVGADHG
jgi:signal transduction histidine kinase